MIGDEGDVGLAGVSDKERFDFSDYVSIVGGVEDGDVEDGVVGEGL